MKQFLMGMLLLMSTSIFAQIYDPVRWETTVEQKSDSIFELQVTALIEPGWHLYAMDVPEGGPVATSFLFKENDELWVPLENIREPEGKIIDDPVFEMQIRFFEEKALFTRSIKILKPLASIEAEVEYMVCDDSKCLPPTVKPLKFELPFSPVNAIEVPAEKEPASTEIQDLQVEVQPASGRSLWNIFLIAFISGFAALLTPCVFPMIPLTVSFFTKQSKNKARGIQNAFIYGLAVIAIYVILGTIVTGIFGADKLNALSTNVWFNLIFFVLLIIFALSFLGAFELTLPHSWANAVDARSSKGGVIGITFMALALAIVSFSCTGPIVGTLLVEAASKGGVAPVVGMLGFSLALALPFTLFAAFPGWLNSLPKSGGWLNTVKVFLGFLELALAFKFLSNADLVLQLHLLERELFLAIWIAIFGALALYLFGFIKLPHDSPTERLSVLRVSIATLVTAFVIYLIPGLWGAPLKMISGFPPPLNYSESPWGLQGTNGNTDDNTSFPEGAKKGAHQILTFTDYNLGRAYAQKVNKPMLIDFTGHACVNCRKMEDNVWSDPEVLSVLKNEVVLISLYVDDKRPLPGNSVEISEITGKPLKYIGQKWSEFQILKYQINAQPFYVLEDHQGNALHTPSAYNPDVNAYLNWLKEGISKFNDQKERTELFQSSAPIEITP